jgi:uncharacterized protein
MVRTRKANDPRFSSENPKGTRQMALDSLLLQVLACPEDKGPLLYFEDEQRLYNPRLKRSYAITDGIPNMLIDEATTVDDEEHQRLMSKAESGSAVSTMSGSDAS